MKRITIAAAYGLGGLALAAVVSVAAFAATNHELSDPTQPIPIGRSTAPDQGGSAANAGAGQDGQPGGFTPSWTPSASPAQSADDHPSGSASDDDRSGSGSDDPSGSGDHGSSGDDTGSDDSSGSGSGDDHSGGSGDD